MTTPDAANSVADPQIDPKLVLAKIESRGELGAALVYGAHMHVLAEHYAAEVGRLRNEQDGATASPQE